MKKLVLAGALAVVLSTVSFSQSILTGWSSGSYNEKWYGVQKEFNIWGSGSLAVKAYVEGGYYNSSTSYPLANLSGQGLGAQGGLHLTLNTNEAFVGAGVKYWFGGSVVKALHAKLGTGSFATSFTYSVINFGTGTRTGTGLFKAF